MSNLIQFTQQYRQRLETALKHFGNEPVNDDANLELAKLYQETGQLASAATFLVRVADNTEVPGMRYNALVRLALIFWEQGRRYHSVQALLHYAVGISPNSPLAHYHLAKLYETTEFTGHWHMSYAHACAAYANLSGSNATSIETPPKYAVIFQKALASWWIGLLSESYKLLRDLYLHYYTMDRIHYDAVTNALLHPSNDDRCEYGYGNQLRSHNFTGVALREFVTQNFDMLDVKLLQSVYTNYSQAFQDVFVLLVSQLKRQGTFIEIGCSHPLWHNNTYLLESHFEWCGLSVDINEEEVREFNSVRQTFWNVPVVRALDATTSALDEAIKAFIQPRNLEYVDYLQVDIDPADQSLIALKRATNVAEFAIITFEHDKYAEGDSVKKQAYKHLNELGYVRIGNDISADQHRAFEDWYIHPKFINTQDPPVAKLISLIKKAYRPCCFVTPAPLIFKRSKIHI